MFLCSVSLSGQNIQKYYVSKNVESGFLYFIKPLTLFKNSQNTCCFDQTIRPHNDSVSIGMTFTNKQAFKVDSIVIINNDTVIDKICLQELIKWIESDNQLWAVSSINLDRWIENEIKEKTKQWEVRITNAFWLQIREKAKISNDILYTNFLCGCSFLYKKSIVDRPFFDFYNAYAEDLQLSREIILKWYSLGVCKNAIVNHFGSGTMNKNPKYLYLYYNNRNLLINYNAFLSKKLRVKLFLPFILFNVLQILDSFRNLNVLKAS